jgi:hypothetical protein
MPRFLLQGRYVPRHVSGPGRAALYRRGLVATWALLAVVILGSRPAQGGDAQVRLAGNPSADFLAASDAGGAGVAAVAAGAAGAADIAGGNGGGGNRADGADRGRAAVIGLAGRAEARAGAAGTPGQRAQSPTDLYRAAAASCPGLRWEVLAAIARVETNGGSRASVSAAGALGPMQFLPATWAAYRPNESASVTNLADAAVAAARLLCHNGAPNNLRNALWNYNHSAAYANEVFALVASIQGAGRFPF